MKKMYLAALLAAAVMVSCGEKKTDVDAGVVNNPNTAGGTTNAQTAAISFEESVFDFGETIDGQTVEHVFKFTNSGSSDLIITDAKGSCGCTVPEFPKEPVKPGASGEIKVKFDSSGKPGFQEKTVTITANTQPQITTLTIKGNVKSK